MNIGHISKQDNLPLQGHWGKGTLPAQHTTFNTLDNWGHKTPPNQKGKGLEIKELKGHGPEHVYNTLGYIYIFISPLFQGYAIKAEIIWSYYHYLQRTKIKKNV